MNNVLCFGDSNTWGYSPYTKERFSSDIRWTGLLRKKFINRNVEIIEAGLCGRTTIYEDETRPGRKGLEAIKEIFESEQSIDAVVIMLGTNDCKTYNRSTPASIANGIDKCLDVILKHVSPSKVLLLSPIYLGENVWKEGFDTEFNPNSVLISKALKEEYRKIAVKRGVHFLSASDYADPSAEDQEHLNETGHRNLADVIYKEIAQMNISA